MDEADETYMRRAVELARRAEEEGQLPVGAVIELDGELIAEGTSGVLEPDWQPGAHAVMVALEAVEAACWSRAAEMTCYTTLEPCVMCAGALVVHGVARVVFGAQSERDDGAAVCERVVSGERGSGLAWEGPAMPEACDDLRERGYAALADLPEGCRTWRVDGRAEESGPDAEQLDAWLECGEGLSLTEAREATARRAEELPADELVEILPYAVAIFERGGYLKDYRALEGYAERAGHPEMIERVDETLREELPDVWIRRALEHGDRQAAIECWFEAEGHRRARLVADELVEACEGHLEVLISARLSQVSHLVERGSRRRYRRACDLLRQLRDELEGMGESTYWPAIIEDLAEQYDNRPAWIDEMEQSGFEVGGIGR
jgi:tRNA(adenine34) deaminase